jgi:hypothetical protein
MLSCIIAVVVVVALVVCGYYAALNTANVNMIVKDAFAKRAQAVLLPSSGGADRVMLERLFTPRVIAMDEMLNSSYYKDFEIINYYEDTDLDWHIVWPWDEEVTLAVTEQVRDITGWPVSASGDLDGEENEENTEETPLPWRNGVYEVTLKKDTVTESWRISVLTLVKPILPEEDAGAGGATPSPQPSASDGLDTTTVMDEVPEQTPQPEASPSPSASPESESE